MMTADSAATSVINRLVRDRGGNFGIMTAVILPVLAATVGVAVDLNQMVQVRGALQDASDSAVLSAANLLAKNPSMSDEEVLAFSNKFMKAQFNNTLPGIGDDQVDSPTKEDPLTGVMGNVERDLGVTGKTAEVTLSARYTMPTNAMTSLLGWETVTVSVTATAQSTPESKAALSMYLVLDRSGSMSFTTDTVDKAVGSCVNYTASNWAFKDILPGRSNYINPTTPCYVRKIQALKAASSTLLEQLLTADPKSELARIGAVAYNDSTFAASGLAWGVSTASSYISVIPALPLGGTDASGGMKIAFDALKASNTAEKTAHAAKGNTGFNRYIVLMTDGEMTGNSSSWNAAIDTQVRTHCTNAKNDGIKIFTVAFMAPDRGKSLLSACASSLNNYYEPKSMSELVKAFADIGKVAAKASTVLTN